MRTLFALALIASLAGCGTLVQAGADASSGYACPAPSTAGAPIAPKPVPGVRIGLALGSGSEHGFAHIGVIEALEARGVDIETVAGTSVGALIGGLWASGLTGRQVEALSRNSDWENVGDVASSWEGLMTNRKLRDDLQRIFGKRPIEAWPKRFVAVATILSNGHRKLLMTGDGAVAIQASTAVPVLFAPVTIDGERLADGALVEPVPVSAARAIGADYVIAVDVAYRPYEERASGFTGNGFQAMHILLNNLTDEQIRHADFIIRLDVHQELMHCGPQALIEAGRDAVRRAWPQLQRSLAARSRTNLSAP